MNLNDLSDSLVYPRISRSWPRGPCATFLITGSTREFLVPLAFFASSKRNNLAFAEKLMLMLVNEPGKLFGQGGESLDLTQAPGDAFYVLVPDEGPFTWYAGPQGRSQAKAAPVASEDDESLSGNSGSQSVAQNLVRIDCVARDFGCIVSRARHNICDAAHFAPKIPQDVYAEVLAPGYAPDDLYHVSSAALLAVNLHRSYDNMAWSFYCDGGEMIVHVFSPNSDNVKYHGHVVPPDTFRVGLDCFGNRMDSDLPETRLCNWHYRQTVVRNIRAFSFGFSKREPTGLKRMRGQAGAEEGEVKDGSVDSTAKGDNDGDL